MCCTILAKDHPIATIVCVSCVAATEKGGKNYAKETLIQDWAILKRSNITFVVGPHTIVCICMTFVLAIAPIIRKPRQNETYRCNLQHVFDY